MESISSYRSRVLGQDGWAPTDREDRYAARRRAAGLDEGMIATDCFSWMYIYKWSVE